MVSLLSGGRPWLAPIGLPSGHTHGDPPHYWPAGGRAAWFPVASPRGFVPAGEGISPGSNAGAVTVEASAQLAACPPAFSGKATPRSRETRLGPPFPFFL